MPYSARQINRLLRDDWIPAAEMPHRAGRVAETVTRRAVFEAENESVNAAARLYADMYANIRDVADNAASALSVRKIEQNRRGQQWRRAVVDAVDNMLPTFKAEVAANALRYATRGYLLNYYGRAWQLAEMGGQLPQFTLIDEQQAAQTVVQHITEDVYGDLVRDLLGRDFRDYFGPQLDDMVARIQSSLYTGMVEGEGISDIMRRVRDTMGVSTDRRAFIRGGVLNKTRRANFNTIQTLTRTVVNKASNDGAIALYRQNADVVTGYTWITARDERVCPTCLPLNGTRYALNDSYRPPAHPNCRCAIIPDVVDDWMVMPQDAAPDTTFVDFLIGFGVGWLIGDRV